jgi:glycine hydroxymethyltransferase
MNAFDTSSTRKDTDVLGQVRRLLAEHEEWRGGCLNLIASENVLSPAVNSVLASDLVGRYADYTGRDLTARRYRGTRHIAEIESIANALACQLFGAAFTELRPLSGHVAGAAVILALCEPGDVILEVGPEGGSHREATKATASALTPVEVRFLPFDASHFNVDAAAAISQIEELQPRLVILGSSNFLFPHPVRELAEALHATPRGLLIYDASHVLGLMAGGRFQQPLREGADLVYGSTHKTFPGPQGGIILSDREDLMQRVSAVVYPGLVTNHHPFRMPALTLALEEMRIWGDEYAAQVIANSQRLGAALGERGIEVVGAKEGYTESHTLLLQVGRFGSGGEVARRLEDARIITTAAHLPAVWGTEGIRIGTQEITRRGAQKPQMDLVADLISAAVQRQEPVEQLASRVTELAGSLQIVSFTWQE